MHIENNKKMILNAKILNWIDQTVCFSLHYYLSNNVKYFYKHPLTTDKYLMQNYLFFINSQLIKWSKMKLKKSKREKMEYNQLSWNSWFVHVWNCGKSDAPKCLAFYRNWYEWRTNNKKKAKNQWKLHF